MSNEFEDLPSPEETNSENYLLKFKMMLEGGPEMASPEDLDRELENAFQKYFRACEKEFDANKSIKIYDKIGRPAIVELAAGMSEDEIDTLLIKTISMLYDFRIDVSVRSPGVTKREFYRYIIEEVFQYKVRLIRMLGWPSAFCYDDFHPDVIYENTLIAENICMRILLSDTHLDLDGYFHNDNLRLNEHYPLSKEEFRKVINNFKDAYDDIKCTSITDIKCERKGSKSTATGNYSVELTYGDQHQTICGKWMVGFESIDNYVWDINDIQVEGINF